MSKMLLGETQQDLESAVESYFSTRFWSVQLERNGLHILDSLRKDRYDVIVLEMALPGLNGVTIAKNYRASGGSTPILLLAGKYSSDELQCGLEAGADSYLAKPFRLEDLDSQLKALIRRPALRGGRVLVSGSVRLNTEAGTISSSDTIVHLRPMEFKLLQFLMSHPSQVFSAHALFERVWNSHSSIMEDTVRTHIRTLRQKIDSVDCKSIITTVRGFGYRTDCD